MKKLIFAIALLPIFFSCKKKEEPAPTPIVIDDRDKFVGEYQGTSTFKYTNPDDGKPFEESNAFVTAIVKSGTKIKMGEVFATVNGNTFVTEQYTTTRNIDGQLIVITLEGGAYVLNGSSLTGTIPMYFIYNGQKVNGTYAVQVAKK